VLGEDIQKLNSGNLTGAQATGANSYGLGRAVYDSLNLTDIGLPASVCFAMRVRNCLSENNALSTNAALCHIDTSLNARTAHLSLSKI
jgi:hypothetical protein